MEDSNHLNGVIILRVNINCQCCGSKVLKCLCGYEGVEGVEIDAKNQKVIVKGEKANPIKVAERLRKKTRRHVELIHPKLVKQEKEKEKEKEKVKPPKVIEIALKIYIHCKDCAKEVKHCIHDMEGVQTVDVDMEKNVVMVKGSMDPHKLVEFVRKKGGRYAEILKQSELNGKDKTQIMREGKCCYGYASQEVYEPQIFSDENPNSCSLM